MANSQQAAPSGLQYVNSPFGDTAWTKVFVGGLAWETQSETMRRYFEQFGEILEAVVITDKNTGRSKGYGFVTFRDPESARRAWASPNPVIDGRRANCNLASLGRPQPEVHFGQIRSQVPYPGGLPAGREARIGSFGYQQPVMYGYHQGLMYPPYGYAGHGPEYALSQGVHNPSGNLELYGVPGTLNSTLYPYKSFLGSHVAGQQIVQFGRSTATTFIPTTPRPYPTGVVTPQLILPVHSPHVMQGSRSYKNAGLP